LISSAEGKSASSIARTAGKSLARRHRFRGSPCGCKRNHQSAGHAGIFPRTLPPNSRAGGGGDTELIGDELVFYRVVIYLSRRDVFRAHNARVRARAARLPSSRAILRCI